MAWIRCLIRNRHNPVRHPLGGFKCIDCGEVGADLEEMGFVGGGYVSTQRRTFDRDEKSFTREWGW